MMAIDLAVIYTCPALLTGGAGEGGGGYRHGVGTVGEENPFGVSPDPTRGICLIYGLEKYSDL
jgi:hypothetical protein